LLSCCAAELRAEVLFAGHHGSKTSSRTAFLDAVQARIYVISSGPKTYGGTSLPDREVVQALSSRGSVWRTDIDDAACGQDATKIGSDDDDRPGGCDNVVLTIHRGQVSADYHVLAD
jgi:competence protein ComEC